MTIVAFSPCPRCGKTTHREADCAVLVGLPARHGAALAAVEVAMEPMPPGSPVGEYVVEAVIGIGGMGTVYRARHPIIGKRVAVKVLREQVGDDRTAVKRFRLEARAVNEIRHRNLVDIFSFGQLADGRWYHVMEYLEGETLGQRLRTRLRLPPAEAIPVFTDVTRALEAAHAKSIVHRDLKPDNVFLTSSPEGEGVKLLDFGVAKLLEGRLLTTGPRTAHGKTVGTPAYMAPEQIRGQTLDGRTDLYALGVMLFETVTGTLPFQGEDFLEICRNHVIRPAPRALERAPAAVTPALDRLIDRLLAKAPQARFQTAAELRHALQALP